MIKIITRCDYPACRRETSNVSASWDNGEEKIFLLTLLLFFIFLFYLTPNSRRNSGGYTVIRAVSAERRFRVCSPNHSRTWYRALADRSKSPPVAGKPESRHSMERTGEGKRAIFIVHVGIRVPTECWLRLSGLRICLGHEYGDQVLRIFLLVNT